MGNNGQVIIDVIPYLELVIGPQPVVAEVGPTEAQNRFQMFLLRFIKTLSDKEHPFIMPFKFYTGFAILQSLSFLF